MKQLTFTEAERCARACNKTFRFESIPLDPDFWFPKLWEAGVNHKSHQHTGDAIRFVKKLLTDITYTAKFPVCELCLALCGAIEALEATDAEH